MICSLIAVAGLDGVKRIKLNSSQASKKIARDGSYSVNRCYEVGNTLECDCPDCGGSLVCDDTKCYKVVDNSNGAIEFPIGDWLLENPQGLLCGGGINLRKMPVNGATYSTLGDTTNVLMMMEHYYERIQSR
jgi:hypothetical protein